MPGARSAAARGAAVRRATCRFEVAGGAVSGVVTTAAGSDPGPVPAVILAHGAGNDMHQRLLVAVADGLAGHGYRTVRFNFPYKEQGWRAPDRAPVLEACYRSVIDQVRADFIRVLKRTGRSEGEVEAEIVDMAADWLRQIL